ncbi:MAG: hypothetical protein MN733_37220, partial [Nitrososphaera sp.]|nr:hypothetical protein [Nitrososphaera sp.]
MIGAFIGSGCSQSYHGERLLWRAQQRAAKILAKSDHVTPEKIAEIVPNFEKVIKNARGTESAAQAQLAIGTLYAMQGEYPKARETLAVLASDYRRFHGVVLAAQSTIAKTYALEKQWDQAVRAYTEMAERYPWTIEGMEAPLYVLSIYSTQGKTSQWEDAHKRALKRYAQLASDAPTK